MSTKHLLYVALFAALIAIGAQIRLPIGPVPVTMPGADGPSCRSDARAETRCAECTRLYADGPRRPARLCRGRRHRIACFTILRLHHRLHTCGLACRIRCRIQVLICPGDQLCTRCNGCHLPVRLPVLHLHHECGTRHADECCCCLQGGGTSIRTEGCGCGCSDEHVCPYAPYPWTPPGEWVMKKCPWECFPGAKIMLLFRLSSVSA